MAEQISIFALMAVTAPLLVMLTMAILSYIHSRRLGDDVLRSLMFLKAHLLRRGYFIFILAAVGMFFLTIPMALNLDMPAAFHLVAAILVMISLALGTLHFYMLVAPKKSPLSRMVLRVPSFRGGLKGDEESGNLR
ncbi:MAG: hypothetical protein ACE5HJ_02870 [Thermoplasmata archaeon]